MTDTTVHAARDIREPRSATMRMIANELASGSDRARLLSDNTAGFIHWLRIWADQLDWTPAHDEGGALVVASRYTLADAIHAAPSERGWRPTWTTAEHLTTHLLNSGAVEGGDAYLVRRLRELAEDEASVRAINYGDKDFPRLFPGQAPDEIRSVLRALAEHLEQRGDPS